MSVLNFTNLTACASKIRKDGYWHSGIQLVNGIPVPVTTWIENAMTTACKYDRKRVDPACTAAKCPRIEE